MSPEFTSTLLISVPKRKMNLQIDRDYLVKTLVDLVQIDSTNPSLSPDGAGEAEIGAYVADVLSDLGLAVTAYEIAPKRVNVVGHLPGQGSGKSLLWNAHMDTVGAEGMANPLAAEIRDG